MGGDAVHAVVIEGVIGSTVAAVPGEGDGGHGFMSGDGGRARGGEPTW